MAQRFPRLFLLLLGFLLILNLFQAWFTELLYDEAYYWYYSQTPSWGYFDHPPMVAAMVWVGELFFNGELAVRLISCFMGVGTYLLLWLLIDNPKKNDYTVHFFFLLFSMALVNAYGFFTLPDTPLLFFTVLFLFVYKKFLGKRNVFLSIALGLTMAALMYSKYHAVLVIVFVLISNWRLVLDKYAWLAVSVSLICYAPHILWLYENDFISVKYHLFERPNHAYSFSEFTLGYVLNLILVFGLLFPWVYKALFKSKSNDDLFVRALQFLSYGFILFFFLSSFSKRIQTQWIVLICVPMALLTFTNLIQNQTTAKWVFRMGIISTLLLLYARVWLINDRLLPIYFETHDNKDWVKRLSEETGDIPIVFQNSYRNASMYAFYSGNLSFSLNTTDKRQNQFTIDDSESKVQGKRVAYIAKDIEDNNFEYVKSNGSIYQGKYLNSFKSYRKLWASITEIPLEVEKLNDLKIAVYNPYQEDILKENLEWYVAYLNQYKEPLELKRIECVDLNIDSKFLKKSDTLYLNCSIPIPADENVHYIRFGISENGLKAGINSKTLKLKL